MTNADSGKLTKISRVPKRYTRKLKHRQNSCYIWTQALYFFDFQAPEIHHDVSDGATSPKTALQIDSAIYLCRYVMSTLVELFLKGMKSKSVIQLKAIS